MLHLALPLLIATAPLRAQPVAVGPSAPLAPPLRQTTGADESSISFTLDFPSLEASATQAAGSDWADLAVPGCGFTTLAGAPRLPICLQHVEIPQGATVHLELLSAEYRESSLAELGLPQRVLPAQPPIPKVPGARESTPFAFDAAAYHHQDTPTAALAGEGHVRAYRFAEVQVNPIQYDPESGALRLLTHAELRLSFQGADWPATQISRQRLASPEFDTFAQQHLLLLPQLNTESLVTLELPIGYLIIAHDDFMGVMDEFAAFKQRQGYQVQLMSTTDAVGDQGADGLIATIQDAYDNWDIPPTFVLLVGDTDLVPTLKGRRSRSATDLYFSTMGAEDDWLPDLYIGSFSVQTEDQAALMVDKTIRYTTFDFDDTDWVQRATFMASSDNSQITEATHEYCIDTWLDPADFESNRRYSRSYHATIDEVVADIDAGLSQITYSGHGSVNSWDDGPAMRPNNVLGLQNVDMWPVVQSYACLTGQFDKDCWAETWTLVDNGAVAFWASSTTSSWNEDDTLERGVYDAWFGDEYTWLRGMLNEGMWALYERYAGGGETNSYFEQYNLFGDPSLDVWTAVPQEMILEPQDGKGAWQASIHDSEGAPVADALVSLFKEDVFQVVGYSDEDGLISFDLPSEADGLDSAEIWVGRHNYLPIWQDVSLETAPDDPATGDTAGGDPSDSPDDTGADEVIQPACGCTSSGGARSMLLALLGLLIPWRRRRSA